MSQSSSDLPAPTGGDFILYTAPDGALMAELFQRDKSVISRHINNVFDEGELVRKRVVANYATTAADGKTYQVEFFNLDAIIRGTVSRELPTPLSLRLVLQFSWSQLQEFIRLDDPLKRARELANA